MEPQHALLPLNPGTRQAVRDLLLLLQHPYIMPVHHFDLLAEQGQVVVMHELTVKGSLRDLVHNSNPISEATKK
jgi:hypothetical protein